MKNQPANRTAMLFLAAGASRRMGRSKALLPWNGTTVIGYHFEVLNSIHNIDPWVVTQEADEPLFSELDAIGWPTAQRVVNPLAPDCDMLESIRCGTRGILTSDRPYQTIGIALIDQVLTKPSTFKKLEALGVQVEKQILQPEFRHRRGHPVLFSRSMASTLQGYTGRSLKHFLEEQETNRLTVVVSDEGVVKDMDTPEHYREQLLTT